MKVIKKILKLLLLNMIWLLFCLPVITIGSSTAAAFSVTLKLAKDEEVSIWSQFIKGFRQSFLQGMFMGFFTAGCTIAAVFLWKRILEDPSFFPIVGGGIFTVTVILLNFFAFPLIARYENTFKNVIKNSVSIFVQFFQSALMAVIIVSVEVAIIYFSKYIFFVTVLFMPVLIFYTISVTAKDCFDKLEQTHKNAQ
ncbi:MAG: YesL family protein [Treponema sp.]|nr:YesL family protein [Treponema sp.]